MDERRAFEHWFYGGSDPVAGDDLPSREAWAAWQARAQLDGTQLLALHDDLMKKI